MIIATTNTIAPKRRESPYQRTPIKEKMEYSLPSTRHRGAPKFSPVIREQKTTSHRHTQHLVRVHRHAVRPLYTLQPPLLVLTKRNATAPASINMEPQPVSSTHVTNLFKRVERPQHRCTCSRIHIEWCETLLLGLYH